MERSIASTKACREKGGTNTRVGIKTNSSKNVFRLF